MVRRHAYLDNDAARALAAGWGGRRAMLLAAARQPSTSRRGARSQRDGGVSRAGVVELTAAMVNRAAGA